MMWTLPLMSSVRVLFVIGIRPKAIKMASIVQALRFAPWAEVRVRATAEGARHRATIRVAGHRAAPREHARMLTALACFYRRMASAMSWQACARETSTRIVGVLAGSTVMNRVMV